MKLSKVIDPRFNSVLKKLQSAQVSLPVALKIKTMAADVRGHLNDYEQARVVALNKYGNKKPDGSLDADDKGIVGLSEDNAKPFAQEINDMLSCDVNITKLNASDLNGILISADELYLLEDVISL